MFSGFDFDVIERSFVYLFRDGMTFTVTLTAIAMTGGIVFGTLLAMMRLSSFAPLSAAAGAYVNLMRSVPLVLVIFWFYFLVPWIGGWLIGAKETIKSARSSRASSPSPCSKPPTTARSCAPASSRCRAAKCRRAMRWA
jgi:glutamate/aspartate transport system permease protein